MRVSFGPTSSLEPTVKKDSNMSYDNSESNTGLADGNVVQDEQDMIRQLKRERDECLKREETLKDRLKLQETLNNKQVQDLRAQVKKLTVESQKVQKSRESISGPGGGRSERKREGKTREVRELIKTVDVLKAENETLRERLNKLSEFVKVAGDLKARAVNQCASKNELIQSLQGELQVVECLHDEETQRRIQAEGEITSLRTYIAYIGSKNRDKMRNKSAQTETSIPPKFVLSGKGAASGVDITSSSASFANLSAAAANWRLKQTEATFQEETKQMKKKFDDAAHRKKRLSSGRINAGSSSWRQRSRRNHSVPRDRHSTKELGRGKESSSQSSGTDQSTRQKSVRSFQNDKDSLARSDAQVGDKDARDSKSDRSSESPRPYRTYFGKMETAQPIPPPPTKTVPGHTTHPHRAHKAHQRAPVMAMAEIIYNSRSTNELEPIS